MKTFSEEEGERRLEGVFKMAFSQRIFAELNSIEVLISKTLIDSYVSHDKFVSVNNAFREYDDMKEKKEKR